MPTSLIVGDTVRIPELRHEVPIGIPDAFMFVEHEGGRHVVVTAFEIERVAGLGLGLEAHPFEEFGYDALLASGLDIDAVKREVFASACASFGVREANVPAAFPLAVAERLREAGVVLTADQQSFNDRRRVKNRLELAGMRRAQRAAEAGMQACVDIFRASERRNGGFVVDGEPLTSELVKTSIEAALLRHGATADEFIVSSGAQAAVVHEMGSGPIAPGESIVVDLWPRDRDSACFADMTRTFVLGEPSDELDGYHRLVREALDVALALVRPGVDGRAVYAAVCDVFEGAGHPTGRSKPAGTILRDGFVHGLGHGVGLAVHERPGIGRYGDELVAGDVVTIEPGLYRNGYGGVRLEDLVLVTDDGCENLTEFTYDMEV
jgi:Xaa-Pro aminopeptidase